MKCKKKHKIFEWTEPNSWWNSHSMAPSAILWNNSIRVFIGAWDKNKISRITYIDLDPIDPTIIIKVKDDSPILDIGVNGMFDENGVFPAHASVINSRINLYYTGFQKGHKIPYYNFGGLAISEDGEKYTRVSKAPILDRQDEGLLVRAGQSVIQDGDVYRTVYSVGNNFTYVGGKERPTYNICYQEISDVEKPNKGGKTIVTCDYNVEHGLGRPQIIKIRDMYYVFYTRRMVDMRYFLGCAKSLDCIKWDRNEEVFSEMKHSPTGFDSEMIYFPSVVYIPQTNKYLLFYCGNEFGKTGFGYAELD
ncbi:hypothetical protein ACFLT1_00025 [Bacteroidota bacterium]